MVRTATEGDTEEIKAVWNKCFSEDIRFNEFFFKNVYNYENTLVNIHHNTIVSVLQRMYYDIDNYKQGELMTLTYLYGIATLPEYRGNGYMKELINKSFELDIAKGISGTILIPANKNLFSFYGKFDFRTIFFLNKERYNYINNTISIWDATEDDIPNMMRFYSIIDMPYIKRNHSYFRHQIQLFNKIGGRVFVCEHGYAFVSNDEELTVQEFVMDDYSYESMFCSSIMKKMDKMTIHIFKPGGEFPFGMIHWHNDNSLKKTYMNLMFN